MPTKVFIGNLSPDVSNEELRDLFQPFGPLVEYDVLSGFGFVHMVNEEDAKKAIEQLNGSNIHGRHISVEISRRNNDSGRGGRGGGGGRGNFGGGFGPSRGGMRGPPHRVPTVKVFVGNIAEGTQNEELRQLFEDFGEVVEADVLGGFGFVHMKTETEAEAAIAALNGFLLNGSILNVERSTGVNRRGGGFDGPMRGGRGAPRGGGPRGGGMGLRFEPYGRGAGEVPGGFRDVDPLTGVDPIATRDAYLRELMLKDPVMRERLMELLERDRGMRDPFARPDPSFYSRGLGSSGGMLDDGRMKGSMGSDVDDRGGPGFYRNGGPGPSRGGYGPGRAPPRGGGHPGSKPHLYTSFE